ncbi:hypothetical protein BSL78_12425 [Apostichopus japonicus]|uniref:Uncharacterized protein n=1 Tax=Stichopus japonicus TaxID=307972 RepID=A0A2G8KRR9_STIJA|nr:hypothetical protein BSL78_12425 [Apostichopus japonicus]
MSYPHPDNPDGNFLASGGDQVDFARSAVNVVALSDIPPVYLEKDTGGKECLAGERLSLIRSSWGTRMSQVNEPTSGVLALVSFKGENLKEDKVKSLHATVDATLGAGKCDFLRWGGKEILLSFEDMAHYKTFGDCFIQGKFDSGITQIKGASFINTPQCFLEVLSPVEEGSNVQGALNRVVSSFSGAFTHCTVLESKDFQPQEGFMTKVVNGSVPSVAITLIFASQAQPLAAQTKTVLSSSPWQQVTLPAPLQDEIGFDTDYFVNKDLPLPLIGLKTGAPSTGVQITKLVQKKENFDEMVKFYQGKVDSHSVGSSGSSAAGILKAKFELSRCSELVITFLPGLSCENISTARLCFLDKSAEEGKVEISQDKEGNEVISVACYK